MPTKKQLSRMRETEMEFPETRREDDPAYVDPNKKQPADRRKWTRTIDSLPPENVEVETKVDDHMGARQKTTLKMIGNLWVDMDETIMNYTPTHWREKQNKEV